MSLRIEQADVHLIDLKTRLPFKYGIATMTSAPHAFVRVRAEIDGQTATGVAADHLPPKWFTKNPDTPLDVEIDQMLSVIEHAVATAPDVDGETAFDYWLSLSIRQDAWGFAEDLPPLLSNFGTTLVERAVIEACCKRFQTTFAEAVRSNLLGIRLEKFGSQLSGLRPAELLPEHPRQRVIARHTIGMADPITDADIGPDERVDDGLPQSLAECIRRYGLKHFKIKLSGDVERDIDRVARVAGVVEQHAEPGYAFTMDGNEQFRSLDVFREYWLELGSAPQLEAFFNHLMFVEQPFHRDVALDVEIVGRLSEWTNRPPLIIDESDAEWGSLGRALILGYQGTSHKNCKGVFRGIGNACLLEQRRRQNRDARYVSSGEDLANIGPVALLQDLAVAASLGVSSIERNGHHYFAGLSAFPSDVQAQVLKAHGDLYFASPAGWPTLNIEAGELALQSVNAAPLGVGFELDVEQFAPVDEWRKSLGD